MSAWLSGTVADGIGLVRTLCVLAAFAYINAVGRSNPILFNALNLVGALLLIISLTVHFNLASFLLEIAWISISIWGLVRALRQRTPKVTP
jgi:hypothetical protein